MEGLVMGKAKLMASTAPRRVSDPIKRDHRPTYRCCPKEHFANNLVVSIWCSANWTSRGGERDARQANICCQTAQLIKEKCNDEDAN